MTFRDSAREEGKGNRASFRFSFQNGKFLRFSRASMVERASVRISNKKRRFLEACIAKQVWIPKTKPQNPKEVFVDSFGSRWGRSGLTPKKGPRKVWLPKPKPDDKKLPKEDESNEAAIKVDCGMEVMGQGLDRQNSRQEEKESSKMVDKQSGGNLRKVTFVVNAIKELQQMVSNADILEDDEDDTLSLYEEDEGLLIDTLSKQNIEAMEEVSGEELGALFDSNHSSEICFNNAYPSEASSLEISVKPSSSAQTSCSSQTRLHSPNSQSPALCTREETKVLGVIADQELSTESIISFVKGGQILVGEAF